MSPPPALTPLPRARTDEHVLGLPPAPALSAGARRALLEVRVYGVPRPVSLAALVAALATADGLALLAVEAADPRAEAVGRAASAALRVARPGRRGGPLEVLAVRALARGRADLAVHLLEAATYDRPAVLLALQAVAG